MASGEKKPARARVVLTDISSRAWEHPADKGALVALRKLKGFDVLLKTMSGVFRERAWRLERLASFLVVLFVWPLQGAEPVPLERAHAHNDYEHARPLLDALAHGFCSVEADVHLIERQLLVAFLSSLSALAGTLGFGLLLFAPPVAGFDPVFAVWPQVLDQRFRHRKIVEPLVISRCHVPRRVRRRGGCRTG